jgi:osmotically inducible protein OsmC
MQFVAARDKIAMPAGVSIDTSVGIGHHPSGFRIEADLKISLHGMQREEAPDLIDKGQTLSTVATAPQSSSVCPIRVTHSTHGLGPPRSTG